MSSFLVDSNILLDILTDDPTWSEVSSNTLASCLDKGNVFINPIVYAEVSVGFERIEDLEDSLHHTFFERAQIPWEAGFLAGKCFLQYRRRGGTKTSVLPDFFIGAHALISGFTLVTRDRARYQTYFPKLRLLVPKL